MSTQELSAFDQVGAALDEAVAEGYLGDKTAGLDKQELLARRRVVGGYLFLLGYLAKRPPTELQAEQVRFGHKPRSPGHAGDGDIQIALARFQQDAGLKQDNRAGSETWEALQELASFEHPIDVPRWLDRGRPGEVLWRAVYLRLFALGLTKLPPRPDSRLGSKQKQSEREVREGLAGFARLIALLQPRAARLTPSFSVPTLEALFDQHGLCALAKDYLAGPARQSLPKQDQDAVVTFLRDLARIELWLYGYNIDVGNFKRRGPFQQPDRFRQSLSSAMEDFCEDHGKDKKFTARGKRDETAVLTWFFRHLVAIHLDLPDEEDPADADRVVERVLANEETVSGVRGAIKSLGARLWDGIARAWKWLKSVFGRIFSTVKRVAKRVVTNLTRFVKGAALKAFSYVKAAIRAVIDGFRFMKEKLLRGSDPQHMMVFHDGDWDFEVFVNARADDAVIENLTARLNLRAEVFALGSRILGRLISLFLSMLRAGIATGWFAIMLALVRVYKSLEQLKEFAQRALGLMSELDELRAQA